MLSALRYRMYPDEETEERLWDALAVCCYLYNKSLTERKMHFEETGRGLHYKEKANSLPAFKKENPAFSDVHSQVLQNVLKRLERSFDNFLEGRARYPNFKKESRWRSLTYPQASPSWVRRNSLVLPKIGKVRMVKHRPVTGKIKTITVLRTNAEEWYAVITVERRDVEPKEKKEPKTAVGIDLGLIDYAYLSDGTHVENPRFIKKDEKRIVRAQKVLSRRVKGSRNRLRARITLSRRWDNYTNRKGDWQWKLAHSIVDRFDIIGYENLPIRNMVKNHHLAGAIQDAAWSGFTRRLTHVAVMAAALPKAWTRGTPRRNARSAVPESGWPSRRGHTSVRAADGEGLGTSPPLSSSGRGRWRR